MKFRVQPTLGSANAAGNSPFFKRLAAVRCSTELLPNLPFIRRALHQVEPIVFNLLRHCGESLGAKGLGDIAVGIAIIAGRHVRIRLGTGQDHDGNAPEDWVSFDSTQELMAVHMRQVEIKENDVRAPNDSVIPLL